MTRIRHSAIWLTCVLLCLTACAGTRMAYHAADTPLETATVVGEHYYALVREAADLKEAGTLTGTALAEVQSADQTAKPIVLDLTRAIEAYQETRNAQTEAELQAALNKAVIAVNRLITAMREVRS
jgi:hypothetical protein